MYWGNAEYLCYLCAVSSDYYIFTLLSLLANIQFEAAGDGDTVDDFSASLEPAVPRDTYDTRGTIEEGVATVGGGESKPKSKSKPGLTSAAAATAAVATDGGKLSVADKMRRQKKKLALARMNRWD